MLVKQTIAESVGDWYFNRKVAKHIDCPYPCNPTCYNMDFTVRGWRCWVILRFCLFDILNFPSYSDLYCSCETILLPANWDFEMKGAERKFLISPYLHLHEMEKLHGTWKFVVTFSFIASCYAFGLYINLVVHWDFFCILAFLDL